MAAVMVVQKAVKETVITRRTTDTKECKMVRGVKTNTSSNSTNVLKFTNFVELAINKSPGIRDRLSIPTVYPQFRAHGRRHFIYLLFIYFPADIQQVRWVFLKIRFQTTPLSLKKKKKKLPSAAGFEPGPLGWKPCTITTRLSRLDTEHS